MASSSPSGSGKPGATSPAEPEAGGRGEHAPGPSDPFDRAALARNRERAERMERLRLARAADRGAPTTRDASVGGAPDFLVRHALGDLLERLSGVERRFERAVVLDPPAPWCREAIGGNERVGTVDAIRSGADGRVPIAPASCDLVVSVMGLHTVADVPGTLAQVARALRPDGLFLATFPGGDTLRELRSVMLAAEAEIAGGASPRVFPFIDVRDAGALLQRAGLALPVADVDRLTVRYADPVALMHELRAMGMANALAERPRRFLSRAVLMRALALYADAHADPDGRIRATHEIVSLSGWKPHESQQKPLAPGSARARLGDALPDRMPGRGQ